MQICLRLIEHSSGDGTPGIVAIWTYISSFIDSRCSMAGRALDGFLRKSSLIVVASWFIIIFLEQLTLFGYIISFEPRAFGGHWSRWLGLHMYIFQVIMFVIELAQRCLFEFVLSASGCHWRHHSADTQAVVPRLENSLNSPSSFENTNFITIQLFALFISTRQV